MTPSTRSSILPVSQYYHANHCCNCNFNLFLLFFFFEFPNRFVNYLQRFLIRQLQQTHKKQCSFQSSLDVRHPSILSYLSITCCIRSTVIWTTPAGMLFALSHWASYPAVSAFVLSWKQQCDRSWVGVRDELWGNGQDFTAGRERGDV